MVGSWRLLSPAISILAERLRSSGAGGEAPGEVYFFAASGFFQLRLAGLVTSPFLIALAVTRT